MNQRHATSDGNGAASAIPPHVVFQMRDISKIYRMGEVEVQALLHDGAECVAARRVLHRFDLDASSGPGFEVIELRDGEWLISFVGTGWTCDGPHPFDS